VYKTNGLSTLKILSTKIFFHLSVSLNEYGKQEKGMCDRSRAKWNGGFVELFKAEEWQ
jgi:hypothetical protein